MSIRQEKSNKFHSELKLLYLIQSLNISKYNSSSTHHIDKYPGCPRRNVPDFGRVFLMLKYTDVTQNTYVQS